MYFIDDRQHSCRAQSGIIRYCGNGSGSTGVQNNLILSGFPEDGMILATSEIVCNLSYFASGTIKGAAIAIIPDSCLYVIIMALLIPIIGKDGIWLAVTGNQVVGMIFLIPLVLLLAAISGKKKDRLLLLPEEFYSETLIMECELSKNGTEETAVEYTCTNFRKSKCNRKRAFRFP